MQPPGEAEALASIRHVRKRIGAANLMGLGAGILYGFQMIREVGFFQMVAFLSSVFAAVFLLTVVVADLLIGVFKAAFMRANALREGPLAQELGKRFEDLDSKGLTVLMAGEAEFLHSVKGTFSGNREDGGGKG